MKYRCKKILGGKSNDPEENSASLLQAIHLVDPVSIHCLLLFRKLMDSDPISAKRLIFSSFYLFKSSVEFTFSCSKSIMGEQIQEILYETWYHARRSYSSNYPPLQQGDKAKGGLLLLLSVQEVLNGLRRNGMNVRTLRDSRSGCP
ncbi:hypothetical protein MKW98_016352 [Papaver atlanticum]|uniref:Uncharacterized protein n=1 Tax=Papaver atlanticum TaxID=357466 RepID=A0AAD4SH14_9MAGN|nr:hypothetical protein MKW98_016352 [Papaver atlanticum]